jgi:hypothetical protein
VVFANKFVPAVGDKYLAETGYKSQQTEEPVEPDRKDNLWEPVPEDRGAHGDFGAQAKERSLQFWATTHRRLLAAAGAGMAGVAFLLGRSRR